MTTHVEDLRAELARAKAEGRELKAQLALAERERDTELAACIEACTAVMRSPPSGGGNYDGDRESDGAAACVDALRARQAPGAVHPPEGISRAAELLTRRLEADAEPLTWGNVAWDSQRPDVLTLTLSAADGSERRALIPREKVPLIVAANQLAGGPKARKGARRG